MKAKYIDQYGIDSLPQLRLASESSCNIFLTSNQALLDDRDELEKFFKIKIRTPEQVLEGEV